MAYTEAQKRATLSYRKKNLVQLSICMKPEERDAIKAAAAAAGVSVKTYIFQLMEQHK